jgi:hypothetical protein
VSDLASWRSQLLQNKRRDVENTSLGKEYNGGIPGLDPTLLGTPQEEEF